MIWGKENKQMTFKQHLKDIEACEEARVWSGTRTAQQAWDECTRPDWLMWWVAKDQPERKMDLVGVACRISRTVLCFVSNGEDRPRLCIEAVEDWLADPTMEKLEKVRIARHAAYASAASACTNAAAYATAYAAATDAAAHAAAYAAATDADADAYAAATYAAARTKSYANSLALVCEVFACPWTEN
jgi:hypothetical protein